MFEKSIIVAAHPDDEILWFSSILEKVDNVVICFLECLAMPRWSAGREKSLSEHPMKNLSCLGLGESGAFDGADWKNPINTQFGIEISKKRIGCGKYTENYYTLKKELENKLEGYRNVFTHNPWGEYGHEEHIQVYRVVKELQKELRFDLWFSNYCSNKSFKLMLRYISGFDSEYITLATNKTKARDIKNLYVKNGCWTWYDDWKWFNEESFKKDKILDESIKSCGHIFPLNMIKVEIIKRSKGSSRIFNKIVSKITTK